MGTGWRSLLRRARARRGEKIEKKKTIRILIKTKIIVEHFLGEARRIATAEKYAIADDGRTVHGTKGPLAVTGKTRYYLFLKGEHVPVVRDGKT